MRSRLLALLLLSACGYTQPSTVAGLAALSPLEVDPAGLAVALQLPAGLAVPKDGAKLTVGATRGDTGETRKLTLTLQARPGAAEGIPAVAGEAVTVYRLTDADVARLRALQAEVAGWQAETPDAKGRGELGLGLAACTTGGKLPADARGAAYVQMRPDGGFLPLVPDAALRDVLGPALFDAIAPCDGPV